MTCEEVFELQHPLPDVVAMQTRQANLEGTGEIRLRRLVKEALRMRPSRIIVGEVRQEESRDLLIALNSGLPGMSARPAIAWEPVTGPPLRTRLVLPQGRNQIYQAIRHTALLFVEYGTWHNEDHLVAGDDMLQVITDRFLAFLEDGLINPDPTWPR